MPFCVNCGSEVERGALVCPNCGKDPFRLEGPTLEEVDAKLSGEEGSGGGAGIASLMVLLCAVTFLFGAAVWQMGVFNVGQSDLVSTGWTKLRPLSPSVAYDGEEFTATYVNGAGTSIVVDSSDIKATEKVSGGDCRMRLSGGDSVTVKAGDTFTVVGSCDSYKGDGEPYDMDIELSYQSAMSGIRTDHTEAGHIKGTGEGYYSSDRRAGRVPEGATGAPYHVYKAFNFGSFLIVVILIGTIILIYAWYKLYQEMVSQDKFSVMVLSIALCGVVFLILSMFIFMFGFHDLLTYKGGNVWVKPTFTQQYAWIIETVVFGFIGCCLMYLSQRILSGSGFKGSVYPSIMKPSGYVLLLVSLTIYLVGVHNFIYTVDYTDYGGNLAWALEVVMFGALCAFVYYFLERIARRDGVKGYVFYTPSRLLSVVLLTATVLVYVPSVAGSFWDYRPHDMSWIFELFLYAVPCAIFTWAATKLSGVKETRGWLASLGHPVSLLLALASAVVYIYAVNLSLYGNYSMNLSWMVAFVLYALPAVTVIACLDRCERRAARGGRKKKAAKGAAKNTFGWTGSAVTLYTVPLTYLFLIISIMVYLIGVHQNVWARSVEYNWVMELLAFLAPALVFMLLTARKKGMKLSDWQFLEPYVDLVSSVLVIVSVLGYLVGVFLVFAESTLDAEDFLRFLFEEILYAAPALALIYCREYSRSRAGMDSIIGTYFIPSAHILLLGFSFIYFVAIVQSLSILSPHGQSLTELLMEALMFLVPAVYLLYKVDSAARARGLKRSVYDGPLAVIGSFAFIASIFFVYVVGLHLVFTAEPFEADLFLKLLFRAAALVVPAAVFLSAADYLRRNEKGKTSVYPPILVPCAYLLILAGAIVYLFGVRAQFSSASDALWMFQALMYLLPGFYFLWKTASIKKREGQAGSFYSGPLHLVGGILLIAAIVSFVFGFNNFLYSTEQTYDWLCKTFAYLLPGALSLYLGDRLKRYRSKR